MNRVDPLTGLLTKKCFYLSVRNLLDTHTAISFELFRINVERLNIINELFGEITGDKLLQEIGNALQQLSIPMCVAGRLYADNFVVLYPAQKQYRLQITEALRQVRNAFSHLCTVQFACGIYHITKRCLPVSCMCDRANLALKRAKGNYLLEYGEYDEEIHSRILHEQSIIGMMDQALQEKQFEVWMQPKYDTATGDRIIGAEALVRWRHPEKGLISPQNFVPVFERNGFILKLDFYVWERTCQLLEEWRERGLPMLPVSVNISRIDIDYPDLASFLYDLVQKYQLKPEMLQLEITESAYRDNAQQIIVVTRKLQQLGFTILMDDFGSGYSSLNMLKDVPVDILKLDLHFLKSKDQSGRGGNILNSVVRMARWLNMSVIAEGVETLEESDFLRNIGCHIVQGYYYSKPVPAEEYAKMIAASGTKEDPMPECLNIEDMNDIWNPYVQYSILFNNKACAVAMVKYSAQNGLSLLRGNDGYFLLSGEAADANGMSGKLLLPQMLEEDRKRLQCMLANFDADHPEESVLLVRCLHAGTLQWISVQAFLILKDTWRSLLYLFLRDITGLREKIKYNQELV